MFRLIIFLLVKSLPAWAYGGAFTWPLCKVVSEKRGQADIRGFLPLKAFFFGKECKYFCAAKETT